MRIRFEYNFYIRIYFDIRIHDILADWRRLHTAKNPLNIIKISCVIFLISRYTEISERILRIFVEVNHLLFLSESCSAGQNRNYLYLNFYQGWVNTHKVIHVFHNGINS